MVNNTKIVTTCKAINCYSENCCRNGLCPKHANRLRRKGYYDYTTDREARPAIVDGSLAYVPIGTNAKLGYAIIDANDVEMVNKHKWYLSKTGYVNSNNSRIKKYLLLHRFIMGVTDKNVHIDHINGNKLDNRRSNLRPCTMSQNMANIPGYKNSSSIYKGVSIDKKRLHPYKVTIVSEGVHYYAGSFDDEKEAAIAYDCAAIQIHGEFARTNFL